MNASNQTHGKLENIKIRYDSTCTPSVEEQKIVEKFRQQLFVISEPLGIHFETLRISRDKTVILPNTDTLGISSPDSEHKVFVANIKILQQAVEDGINLEGAILHEIGHIKSNCLSEEKLASIVDTFEKLEILRKYLTLKPNEAEKSINKEFGSIESFRDRLVHFDKIITLLERIPEVSANPEMLAALMEKNDPRYASLNLTLDKLVDEKAFLFTYSTGLAVPLAIRLHPDFKLHVIPSIFPKDQRNASLLNILEHVGNPERIAKFKLFKTNLEKASEFAADRYAYENESIPDSMINTLKWLNQHEAKLATEKAAIPVPPGRLDEYTQILAQHILQSEGDTHPSLEKRIARIHYIKSYGLSPEEELARCATTSSAPLDIASFVAKLRKDSVAKTENYRS